MTILTAPADLTRHRITSVVDILYKSAYKVFGVTKHISYKKHSPKRQHISPWYIDECESARREIKAANKQYRKHRLQQNTDDML